MRNNSLFLIVSLLLIAGIQTVSAQKMLVKLADNSIVRYDVSQVDCVTFLEDEFVDLALPSGTLWATYNVGAVSAEDFGKFFAWGETESKPLGDYHDGTYKYTNEGKTTKYNETDGMTILRGEDDAATAAWGSDWQIPSKEQWDELLDNKKTFAEWTKENGVNGLKITSKLNGKSIFLPAAGKAKLGPNEEGKQGYYWSRNRNLETEWEACYFAFDYLGYMGTYYYYRSQGYNVRPVVYQKKPVTEIIVSNLLNLQVGDKHILSATILPEDAYNQNLSWSSTDNDIACVELNEEVTLVAVNPGTCTIKCSATDGSGVKAEMQVKVTPQSVDLGLPSGTQWAICNIGATIPEDFGDYFAWGETEPKDVYKESNYKYCYQDSANPQKALTKYCSNSEWGYNGFTDGLGELLPEDDAATANWGEDWQMPSPDQFKELMNTEYTTCRWTSLNGVEGMRIISKSNNNSIFLPAAGNKYYTLLREVSDSGDYWSRSIDTNGPWENTFINIYPSNLHSTLNEMDVKMSERIFGFPIRPVRKK